HGVERKLLAFKIEAARRDTDGNQAFVFNWAGKTTRNFHQYIPNLKALLLRVFKPLIVIPAERVAGVETIVDVGVAKPCRAEKVGATAPLVARDRLFG